MRADADVTIPMIAPATKAFMVNTTRFNALIFCSKPRFRNNKHNTNTLGREMSSSDDGDGDGDDDDGSSNSDSASVPFTAREVD